MTDERTANFATSCGSCVFAQWDDNKQTGCDLDRLVKYIKTDRAQYDEEKNCFIISTICNTCRGEHWANKNLGKNLVATVEDEIKLSVDFMILILDQDMEKIEKRLPNLLRQCINQKSIKPKNINVVLKSETVRSANVHKIILDEDDKDIKFNLIRILDLSYDIGQCIDSAMKKSKSNYCAIFMLCDNIPSNLLRALNHIINVELKSVNMIEPYSNFSGLIIQPNLYKLFGGNKNFTIYHKVKEAAKIQEKEKNIMTWEKIWTYPK